MPVPASRPVAVLICLVACATAGCGGQDVEIRPIGDGAASRACLDSEEGQVCVTAGDSAQRSQSVGTGAGEGAGAATEASPGPGVSSGASETWGGGDRIGTFGSEGTAALTGAVSWSGAVTDASCDATNDIRVLQADLPAGRTLKVDVTTQDIATITLSTERGVWTADWVSGADQVITLTAGTTVVRQARLSGGGGTVILDAEFDC